MAIRLKIWDPIIIRSYRGKENSGEKFSRKELTRELLSVTQKYISFSFLFFKENPLILFRNHSGAIKFFWQQVKLNFSFQIQFINTSISFMLYSNDNTQ